MPVEEVAARLRTVVHKGGCAGLVELVERGRVAADETNLGRVPFSSLLFL